MSNFLSMIVKAAAGAVVGAAFSVSVAAPTLVITTGDGAVAAPIECDIVPLSGCTFTGPVGEWYFNADNGITLTAGANGAITLHFGGAYVPDSDPADNGNVLTLLYTDFPFTGYGSAVFGVMTLGGNIISATPWTVTQTTLVDGVAVASATYPTSAPLPGATQTFSFTPAGSAYSLGQQFQIVASSTGSGSVDGGVQVPEPATVAVLGLGAVGLAALSRRRRSKQ